MIKMLISVIIYIVVLESNLENTNLIIKMNCMRLHCMQLK